MISNDKILFRMKMTTFQVLSTAPTNVTHFDQYGYPINFPGFFMISQDGGGTLPTAYGQTVNLPGYYSKFFGGGGGLIFDIYYVHKMTIMYVPFVAFYETSGTSSQTDESQFVMKYLDQDDVIPLNASSTVIEAKFLEAGAFPVNVSQGKNHKWTWTNPNQKQYYNCAAVALAPGTTLTAETAPWPNCFKSLRLGFRVPAAGSSVTVYYGRLYITYDIIFKGINMNQ